MLIRHHLWIYNHVIPTLVQVSELRYSLTICGIFLSPVHVDQLTQASIYLRICKFCLRLQVDACLRFDSREKNVFHTPTIHVCISANLCCIYANFKGFVSGHVYAHSIFVAYRSSSVNKDIKCVTNSIPNICGPKKLACLPGSN